MVKYTPLPSGVPLGFAPGNSFRQRGIFDCISLLSSQYGYSRPVLYSKKEHIKLEFLCRVYYSTPVKYSTPLMYSARVQ